MGYIKRRMIVKLDKSEMVEKGIVEGMERKVSGTITIDIWDEGLSVIDNPTTTESIAFYIQPGVFGMTTIEGQPPPFITEDEREYIQCIAQGYMYGIDDEGGDVHVWSLDLNVAYQIVDRYSYKPVIDDDGHLIIFDKLATAQQALSEMVDSHNHKVRIVHITGRNI